MKRLIGEILFTRERVVDIHKETNEILAMTVASIKTLRNNKS